MTQVAQELDPFEQAQVFFDSLVSQLRGDKVQRMAHSEVEALVLEQGRELQRQLLEATFRDRSHRERPQLAVVGSDGVERTHRRERIRPLTTVVGSVEVSRIAYGARGEESLMPLDAELNLPVEEYSHGLRKYAAIEASRGSFDEAVEAVERGTGVRVPKRQVEELVRRAATDFESFYDANLRRAGLTAVDDLLVLSFDGKGVVMRHEDLRDATRKAAEKSETKLQTRLSKGEKANRKRMATVVAVYDVARNVRAPEDIMTNPDQKEPKEKQLRPKARNKRVWARLEPTARKVVASGFDEAEKRDPEHLRRWVVLVDGDRSQLRRARAEAKKRGVEVTIVVDFIHVLEYLWRAAWSFHDEGDETAEKWVYERALKILRGRASHVAAGIRRSATKRNLPPEKRKGADRCANYLLAKKSWLRYDEILALGLPIATGVIEGACRHLVKDRMDITGARWSLEGAEAILRIRALRSSGDFETYWSFHLKEEHARIHASHYAELRNERSS